MISYHNPDFRCGLLTGQGSSTASTTSGQADGSAILEGWNQEYFGEAFDSDYEIVVTMQTQTFVGSNTPGIRIMNVTASGFQWRFNEIVVQQKGDGPVPKSDGNHLEESVGYIAVGYPKP